MDTGANVSVVPARHGDRAVTDSFKLYAANGTIIDTYGERSMQVSLGLRRACTWRFIVADVQYAIIGADFLTHYELLPDLKNGRLVDGKTLLYAVGSYVNVNYTSITSIDGNSAFSKLLAEFPGITQPTIRHECRVAHGITHMIETTCQPLTARARRLPPDKLKIARA